MTGGAPPGARSNGEPVRSWWAPLGRCDPRDSGDVLGALANAGIAAYTQPDGGDRGSYLEVRPPGRPMDLVYVEGNRRDEAHRLVRHRLGEHADSLVDEDAAFAAIVAGFHAPPSTRLWPVEEDTGDGNDPEPTSGWPSPGDWPDDPPRTTYRRTIRADTPPTPPGLLDPGGLLGDEIRVPGADPFEDDDEHFVPPKLGKAPPIQALTRLACLAIAAGIALLVAPTFWGFEDPALSATLGLALIVAGAVRLVGRLRDDGDDDPPTDDGAVV